MPYAVELFFDEAMDARIRRMWEEIAGPGGSPLAARGSSPHLALAVCDEVDEGEMRALLEDFAARTPPFSVRLASVGKFPSPSPVVFLAPEITPQLLALHAAFWDLFRGVARGCWNYYAPGKWIPHCTLADDSGTASVDFGKLGLPVEGCVMEIGLVEFRPVKQLFRISLNSLSSPPGSASGAASGPAAGRWHLPE